MERGWNEVAHGHLRKPVDRPATCQQCWEQFQRKSRGRILGKRYCSQACQRQALTKRARERAEARERVCPQCGKPFSPRWIGRGWQRFCSPKCLREKQAERAMVTCAQCGRQVSKMKADAKRRKTHYCSVKCRALHFRGEKHPMYRGDTTPRASQSEWRRLAETIRVRDRHQCRRCGAQQQAGDRAFPIDHVIPWRAWRNKAIADDPRNLVTLCHRCHAVKTGDIERRWLKGDVLAFQQFARAVGVDVTRLAEMNR